MKFSPQDLPKSFIFKQRLKHGRLENYNYQTRIRWYPAGWRLNQISISRRFAQLHYQACHAPAAVQKKWLPAYRAFERRHFGNLGRASMRYLNQWSCHSWL